jgi:hypothetical protein
METHVSSHPRRTILRAIRWGAFGAAAGTVCAAFYGIVFGEVEILLVGAMWRLLPFVGYFASCGLLAGALTGAVAGLFNGHLDGHQGPRGK